MNNGNKTGKAEILAPAGNAEMLTAAVRSGADAVYFGAKEFSARRNAENFDDEALKKAAEYCRIRGVRTYLALNILIKDGEMQSAVDLARRAYNYGVDGVIVADLGLAAVLRRLIPELSLHASTQMSVHTPAALAPLKKAGFCRVVAAREMSFCELKDFCAEADRLGIEVEVFVHGALCMSMSGQCLLSAFLGSRSGNRGLCAGPCRLPFSAPGGTGYDLSLKDLSLIHYIEKLRGIGVTSFKIEGRMKRPEYVAAATAACRSAADNGFVPEELESALNGVFSRSGFTDGYFTGRLGRDMFGIRTKEDVASAASVLPALHGLYRAERQNIKIKVCLSVKNGQPVTLSLDDGKNSVSVSGSVPERALTKAADDKALKAGLDKFGSTPYTAAEISVACDNGLFVRASELNELRRKAAEMLDRKRAETGRRKSAAVYNPGGPDCPNNHPPRLFARFEEPSLIPDDLNGIEALILPIEKEPDGLPGNVRLIADIPRGISSEEAVRRRLRVFKNRGFNAALCGNISAVRLALDEGFSVLADSGLNFLNSESAAAVYAMGAEGIVLSSEILLSDAARLNSPVPKGITAYGKVPLMLFRNCPLKNGRDCSGCPGGGTLTDRRNVSFRVRCRMGYCELLNSVPVWLADRKDELSAADFAVLYFTDESKRRAAQVIRLYLEGGACPEEYTRGLYFRGSL